MGEAMAATDGTKAGFRLAAACCHWPADARRDRAVTAAARGITDWPAFLCVIRRHRVEPLAHAALSAAPPALHFLYALARPPLWLWRKFAATSRRRTQNEPGSA
jgi:hypothetical protein